jgi:hypothetical protein
MHVCEMHFWPFLHSSSCWQSCAALKPVGAVHEPPFARAWQTETAEMGDRLISPQQLSPAGQSHEYWQWAGASPLLHVAVLPNTHRPVGVVERVTQHVLARRSQVDVPSQTGGE